MKLSSFEGNNQLTITQTAHGANQGNCAFEKWVDIRGYEGNYQISSLGRIKSINRIAPNGQAFPERIMKQRIESTGYMGLTLWKNNKSKMHHTHRLLLDSFVENPFCKRVSNHKDGNKLNNDLSNLEWATYTENLKHAYKNNLNSGRRKLNWDTILDIRRMGKYIKNKSELARKFDVNHSTIQRILTFKTWNYEA